MGYSTDLTVLELMEQAHANAREKGFWDNQESEPCFPRQFWVVQLMLIVTELSAAVEALRQRDWQEDFENEMADVWIRLADFCGGIGLGPEMEHAIRAKMEYNGTRPRLHGKLF